MQNNMDDFVCIYGQKNITTNIARFGQAESNEAALIFAGLSKHGYPEEFDTDGIVSLAFNANFGSVYLMNDKGQKAAVNSDPGCGELYMIYTLPDNGMEGAADEISNEYSTDSSAFSVTDVLYMWENKILPQQK